jgi:hypothetical protein
MSTTLRPSDGRVRSRRSEPGVSLASPSRAAEAAADVRATLRRLEENPGAASVSLLALTSDIAHAIERDQSGAFAYILSARAGAVQFQLRMVNPDDAGMLAAGIGAFADELRRIWNERSSALPGGDS